MNDQVPHHATTFTAGLIAKALGRTKRAVLIALADTPPIGQELVRGQPANTWSVEVIPALMRAQLEGVAPQHGRRTAEDLLTHFKRLETQLQSILAPGPAPTRHNHAGLADVFAAHLKDPSQISGEDREWIWAQVCYHLRDSRAADLGRAELREFKVSLANFLAKEVPGLVRTNASQPLKALRRDLDRKFSRFTELGRDGLRDQRTLKSGWHRPPLCPACWEKALALGVKLGGNESLAWRQLKRKALLCPDCRDRHKFDVREAKSYVPRSIRTALTPITDATQDWVKSTAAGRLAGPYIPRDWSDTQPGDFFSSDDVTWNEQVWALDSQGQPTIYRPECLYTGDELTGCPLDTTIILGHYNARHIALHRLTIHDKFGLPHAGWWHENTVWRARLLHDPVRRSNAIDQREVEDWLDHKLGHKLYQQRHHLPRNPRAKIVEGDFRILQERMRAESGFVGFRERDEKSDARKDFERRVRTGKEHPGNELRSVEQWNQRIAQLFEEFMQEPRSGRCHGRSPWEAWQEGLNRRPLGRLADEDRWLLASHKQLVKVTPKGIVLEFSKGEKWTYASGELSAYLGRQVWAFYHFDCPALLTIADIKRDRYFSVKGIRLPANTATREQMQAATRQISEFNAPLRVFAGLIKHPVVASITRDNRTTSEDKEFGRHIVEAKQEHRTQQKRIATTRTRQKSAGINLIQEARLAERAGNVESQP